jgi:hypothetical protein
MYSRYSHIIVICNHYGISPYGRELSQVYYYIIIIIIIMKGLLTRYYFDCLFPPSITLTLELCGEDPRMDPARYAAALVAQDAAVVYADSSGFRYAPLRGEAAGAHSVLQRARAAAPAPPLCAAFAGSSRAAGGVAAVSRCVRKQATQCSIACDGGGIAELFPHSYGARLVSVVADDTPKVDKPAVDLKIGVW